MCLTSMAMTSADEVSRIKSKAVFAQNPCERVMGRISDSCKNQFHRSYKVSFLSATSMASM